MMKLIKHDRWNESGGLPMVSGKSKPLTQHMAFIRDGAQVENFPPSLLETPNWSY